MPRSPADRRSSAHWSNTAPSRRAAGYRRYNAPSTCLNWLDATMSRPAFGGVAGTRLLAPNGAAMYTRLLAGALSVWRRTPYLTSGNAPVVMGRLVMKFGGTSVANI